MKLLITSYFCCLASIWGGISVANAGVLIRFQTSDPKAPKAAPEKGKIAIQGRDIAIESGSRGKLIFHGGKKVFIAIDHGRKMYLRVDEKTAKHFSKQMRAMMPKLRQMLKNLPPEQRKAAAAQLKKMEQKKPAKVSVRKLSGKKVLLKRACERYETRRAKAVIGRGWVASYRHIGLDKTAAQVFLDMQKFFQRLAKSAPMMSQVDDQGASQLVNLPGVPLVWEALNGGKVTRVMRVTAIAKKKFPKLAFAPPKGYQMQSIPGSP